MSRLVFCALLICVGLSPVAQAAPAGASTALQSFVSGVRTLSANFEQVQRDEDGREMGRRSGQFELLRPGRFRWQYTQPYEQLMLCDGERVYNYEPDLAQVTVHPAGEILTGTPAALLAQAGADLGDGFAIEDAGRDDGADRVRLTPRSGESDFRAIELWLAGGVPQRMRFLDTLGGSTDIRFSQVRTGIALDAGRFSFKVPSGVEVIDAAAP